MLPEVYAMIAQSYLGTNDPVKAKKVLKTFAQNYPHYQIKLALKAEDVSLPTPQKRGRGRDATPKTVTKPVAFESPAQKIRTLQRISLLEKCDDALRTLENISFEGMTEMQVSQTERIDLVHKVLTLKERMSNDHTQTKVMSDLREEIT